MKKSTCGESRAVGIPEEAEARVSLEEPSRQHGFSKLTCHI